MNQPDESLIGQLLDQAKTDDEGINRLLDASRSYMILLARVQMRGRNQVRNDASDIVQESLKDAFEDFSRFHGQTPAEWFAWLRQVMRNNLVDMARKERAVKRNEAREVRFTNESKPEHGLRSSQLADASETPSQLALRKEREVILAEALETLEPDYRDVILYRNLQRLSFNEVAERMHRSRPSVQMLWMRAIKKLQGALSKLHDSSLGWIHPSERPS